MSETLPIPTVHDTPTTTPVLPAEDAADTATDAATQADATDTAPPKDFDFGRVGDTINHVWSPKDPVTGKVLSHIKWYVAGEDTKHYRDVVAKAQQAQAERNARRSNADPEAFTKDVLVGVLLEWEGPMKFNGKDITCTASNKRMLFESRRWLFDQFRDFINARDERLGNAVARG